MYSVALKQAAEAWQDDVGGGSKMSWAVKVRPLTLCAVSSAEIIKGFVMLILEFLHLTIRVIPKFSNAE